MVDIKNPKYTYTKNSFFYFSRAVPFDLRNHYSIDRIVISLKTKSPYKAHIASNNISSKLEDYWMGLRLKNIQVPASKKLINNGIEGVISDAPTITEAQDRYLSTKGVDRNLLFFSHTKRAVGYLIKYLGDKNLDQYTGLDSANFRDKLKEKGLSASSIRRNIGCIKAVINFNINEFGLDCGNPFSNVYIHKEENIKRKTIKTESIKILQKKCINKPDDLRLLVALISDTGLRLSEAVGLEKEDIFIDEHISYLNIRKNKIRSLKTTTSTRIIPLVGASLNAAKLIISTSKSEYCFPRYVANGICKTNSASAAANKWIKTIIGKEAVIHGLRHSFRDRLRDVEAPTEVIDQLGGWSMRSIGQTYGEGYKLELLYKFISHIEL